MRHLLALALALACVQASASAQQPPPLASALDAVRATDYPRAERELSAIHTPAADLARAHLLFEQGKLADADAAAQRAQTSQPHRLLAIALRARILASQGKSLDAIRLLDPHKDAPGTAGRRVRLALGELLIASGKRSDAEPVLMKFAEEYNDDTLTPADAEGLAMLGHALHLLRLVKDANDAFNQSERADSSRVETRLWRAELYLEHDDTGHAEEVLREALRIGPKRADALVLLARVKLSQSLDFDEADRLTRDALAVHPRHTGALAVRAGLALRTLDIASSHAILDTAVDPNDLELLALRAATRFLDDDRAGYDATKRDAFARNPEFSRFFQIVAEFAEWEHRYDDIVAMMKEAVAIDPKDAKAWAELGMMQLRGGDETAGVTSLREAWRLDHYNVRVFNTLDRLYEKWVPSLYETSSDGVFRIRYPKKEKAILERYVPRLLGRAWGSMKARYGFVPTSPVQIELYQERQHFSVRTSGLPNIGIQGVCFGRVVAAMSPGSEPFNWGNVLWHELGHVFAIQRSKSHVPRWFTEGLSEYETLIRRPEWHRDLDPGLYRALKRGALPSVVDMNKAFTHGAGGLDMGVAYYAASQMIVFTAETFGMGPIVEALGLWGEGVKTPEVLRRAFGVTAGEYDTRFRAWGLRRLSRYEGTFVFDPVAKPLGEAQAEALASPKSPEAQVTLALALLQARKGDEARKVLETARTLAPLHGPALFLSAKVAENADQALTYLQAMRRAGLVGYDLEMATAEACEGKKDRVGQRRALEAARRYDPTQPEPVRELIDLAKKDSLDPLPLLRVLAPLDPNDRRAWGLLLDALVAKGAWEEARRAGESALFIDVGRAGMHVSYARALAGTGEHTAAVFELESALLCEPKGAEASTVHALLAREKLALGDRVGARRSRDEALRLDPQNAEAKGLEVR